MSQLRAVLRGPVIGLWAAFAASMVAPASAGAPGEVLDEQKISDNEGGFEGILLDTDHFGWSAASLGDLDGDGVPDLAVGSPVADLQDYGAVWVLFLNADGTVKAHEKIGNGQGGFAGTLDPFTWFGHSITSLGDFDGDEVSDIAVGASLDDDGGLGRGAVWILFLNTDGTVKGYQKISDTAGGFDGILADADTFGTGVAYLGDLDGDGVGDLAVGAARDDDGAAGDCSDVNSCNPGAVWILFLNQDGTVKSYQKISQTQGGFTGTLAENDRFGFSLAAMGDLDDDGVADLAVGQESADFGSDQRGAVWILFLNTDGTVKTHQKISDTDGGFTGVLDDGDFFGHSVAGGHDFNGDGIEDLAVGATGDDDGGDFDRGAVWLLFLETDGVVKCHQKISALEGGFTGPLDSFDNFGSSVAVLGDVDGDAVGDLAAGAQGDDGGGVQRGAAWVLFLAGVSPCPWDLDGDGMVGIVDFLDLLAAWDDCGQADFDADGVVGIIDFLSLLAHWGACP